MKNSMLSTSNMTQIRSHAFSSFFALLLTSSSSLLSAVSAQVNVISSKKACYGAGETLVINFLDINPKPLDWVGIVESDATFSPPPSYLQFVYTCGTSTCTTAGPVVGSVNVANTFPNDKYLAVLLSEDSFNVLAISSPFTIAASCSPTANVPTPIPTRRPTRLPTRRPTRRPTSAPVSVPVFAPFDAKPAVPFAPPPTNPPQIQQPTKKPRRRDPTAPVTPSNEILPATPKPSRKPVVRPTPKPSNVPEGTYKISVDKTCYHLNSNFVASYAVYDPKPSYWLVFVSSSVNDQAPIPGSKLSASYFLCGGVDRCSSNSPQVNSRSLFQQVNVPGEYKAIILDFNGNTGVPLAVSQNFTITNSSCPDDPKYTISVSKDCYVPTEAVIATFTGTDAQTGDQIGLIPRWVDLNSTTVEYPSLVYTCGTTTPCTGAAPKSGIVAIFQNFSLDIYVAVLLRGPELTPLAVSSTDFDVKPTC